MITVNSAEKYGKIVAGTKAYFTDNGFKKAVLGMSGGLDSSVTACLAKDALGAENVFALMMPEKGLTSDASTNDAVEFANELGIKHSVQEINGYAEKFKNMPWKQNTWSAANLKPRTRMMMLYNYANANNALVLGTSNRSELLLGYGTKHGDLAADLLPIGGIYKTLLVEIAENIKIPQKIISKEPTAELMPCQTDKEELGAPYAEIDPILIDYCDRKIPLAELKTKYNAELTEKITGRVEKNRHKSATPFIVKL